jgi:FMN-dependent oxidoreductase (nitrilotriacetate monooxygenase family)
MVLANRQMILGMPIHAVGYHPACWLRPDVPPDGAMNFRHALHCAQVAERGKLDFIFLADTAADRALENPAVPREREHEHVKLEPFSLLAALATATRRIGLVATASSTYNHPYNLARSLASLDHLSRGRAGWNLVTGFSIDEARNFGDDVIAPSPERHARARESVDVVRGLFGSWDEDAFIRDKASGIMFERDRLHRLDHQGRFFKVRGPLDVARPPQSMVPVVTAGYSEEASAFTAEYADAVYAAVADIASARDYYSEIKARLPAYGRRAEDLIVLPGIMPFIGRTRQEARDRFEALQAMIDPAVGLGMLAHWGFPDFRGQDLDTPLLDLPVKPGRYADIAIDLAARVRRERPTIRQLYGIVAAGFWQWGCIGTPADIADAMEEWFTTGAADGFNIQAPYLPGVAEDFVELVVPELQRRGLFRREYEPGTLGQRLFPRAAVLA